MLLLLGVCVCVWGGVDIIAERLSVRLIIVQAWHVCP